jgi:hypothetical protein
VAGMKKLDLLHAIDDRFTARHETNLEPPWITIAGCIVLAILFYIGLAVI